MATRGCQFDFLAKSLESKLGRFVAVVVVVSVVARTLCIPIPGGYFAFLSIVDLAKFCNLECKVQAKEM